MKINYIIQWAHDQGGTFLIRDAIATFENCYYYNGAKHIGDMVSRAVRSGKIKRIARGKYQLTYSQRSRSSPGISVNQLELFNQKKSS